MKVTTQRKVTFGILGLAAIAFVIDRCTSSSTPAAAHAMSVAAKEPAKVAYRPAVAASTEATSRSAWKPSRRLARVAQEQNLDASAYAHDAFLRRPINGSHRGIPKGTSAPSLHRRGSFRQLHKLIGVSIAKQRSLAIVDGKPNRLNESVDGFRLVEIHEREAIFECGAARVQLTAPGPAAGANSDNMEIRPARSGQAW